MDKIRKAKANLEHYLADKVKDFNVLGEHTAQLVMSMSVYTVWQSWRALQDVCEGDLK